MPTNVLMPQMGESIFEGTVTKWLKKPGDKVDRDEPLFEISTDKVDAEIPSPGAGVLKEIVVKEGQTVPINTVVAVLEDGGGAAAAAPAAAAPAPAPAKAEAKPAPLRPRKSAKPAAAAPPSKTPSVVEGPPKPAPAPAAGGAPVFEAAKLREMGVRTSPLVRKMAKEQGIDLSRIAGTGAGGRVSKQDVLQAIEKGVPAAPAYAEAPAGRPAAAISGEILSVAVPRERLYFGRYETEPLTTMRRSIAEHMVLSKRTSPHVYSIDEADVTGIAQLRDRFKGEFERKTETKLTFMPFFIRAAVLALQAFPRSTARSTAPWWSSTTTSTSASPSPSRTASSFRSSRAPTSSTSRPAARRHRPGHPRPNQEAQARGRAALDFLHHQPRRLRRPDGAAGHQPAQRRHPRPGRDSEARRGHQRRHRYPLHGLPDAELRPPRRRRRHRPPVPRPHQEDAGRVERPFSSAQQGTTMKRGSVLQHSQPFSRWRLSPATAAWPLHA
jgi:pyruvate/2-oxoglutarate dehydrogenase complex dihydrolipoamide acyltransferase (E2) component